MKYFIQLLKNLWNRLLGNVKTASEAVADHRVNAELEIDSARDKNVDFKAKIVDLMAQKKKTEAKIPALKADVEKYINLGKAASRDSNIAAVTKFRSEHSRAVSRLNSSEALLEQLLEDIIMLRQQWDTQDDVLENAEISLETADAKLTANTLREDAVSAGCNIGSLSAVTKLQDLADSAGNRADAHTEFNGGGSSSYEAKYSTKPGNSAFDDAVSTSSSDDDG